MNLIRKCFRYMVYGHRSSGTLYINHLRRAGMEIGEGTILFNPTTTLIDEGDPFMISIGKNVQITGGVVILSHDYGWSVTKAVYGDVLGSVRPVSIGDNVYIGMNAMILAGATIGTNVIIGANSVVSGFIPDNCVAVGSPCKKIYTIEEYHQKREKAQISEAIQIIRSFKNRFGKIPSQKLLAEHFWLFTNKKEQCCSEFISQNNLMPGSEELTWDNFIKHSPMFNSYEELVDYALNNKN